MNRPNTCANLIKAINSLFKDTDTARMMEFEEYLM